MTVRHAQTRAPTDRFPGQQSQALIEGENSGLSSELDIEAFIADKKKSLSL
ncbi:type II toxin-antitoxin system ParD family antitoxin [Geoalkalibacter subterraneus]|uniref:type II toxin-antitoxin system ParD family antitoxin n=1 Tax=Geoalkalibacter subterraneus TaxID=483547 RepID=UPI003EB7FA77